MISRLVELKIDLKRVLIEYEKCRALNELNFDYLEMLSKILKPFFKITERLSDRNESISSVLPAYFAIKHDSSENDDALISKIWGGLEERMKPFVNEKYESD